MRTSPTWFAYAAVPALVLSAGSARAAAPCDALTAEKKAYDTIVAVRGREQVTREVQLPPASSAIVFAAEQGIDVTLQIERAGRTLARVDNAIPRTGVQRIVLSGQDSERFTVTVTGKEHANANGRVHVTVLVLVLSAARNGEPCVAVQRTLAAADAAYAASQLPIQESTTTADAGSLYKAAVGSYQAAGRALEPLGPSALLAQARHAEAEVLINGVQDWVLASTRATEAAQAYSQIGDPYARARAQLIHAQAQIEVATTPAAPTAGVDPSRNVAAALAEVRVGLQALAGFHSARGERYEQGLAQNEIGVTYHFAAQYDEAIREYRRAVALFEQIGETPRQVQSLQNVAVVEYELGRLSAALADYERVLQLLNEHDDPLLYASVLCNSGVAQWASGNYDLALRQSGAALATFRALNNKYWESLALNTIGSVYDALGERERALEFHRQALTLRTVELAARARIASLRTIGSILREQGRMEEALRMHQEALGLASRSFVRKRVTVEIARDLVALGREEEAMQQLRPVLEESADGAHVERARALALRGQYRVSRKELGEAESDFRAALKTFRTFEQPVDELDTWVSLARAMRARGASDAAFGAVDEALALVEEVRLQTANPELRATLMQPTRPAFDLKIAMFAEQYFAPGRTDAERERIARAALTTAEHARARALADFQTLDVSAPGVPPQLAARRQGIYRELAARRFRLAAALDRGGTEDARVRAIHTDIGALRRELDEIDAQIGTASNANRKVARAEPFETRSLGPDTAVVAYWLGENEALAWLIDSEGVVMRRLQPTQTLTAASRAFDESLRAVGKVPLSERLKQGRALSDLLLGAFGSRALRKRTLIFVPDGPLHYVAFAALRIGTPEREQFLVESHDLALAPSVGMYLNEERARKRAPPTRQMLLVADPVYELNDVRLTSAAKSGEVSRPAQSTSIEESSLRSKLLTLFRDAKGTDELSRLPGSADEAAAIAALLPDSSIDRLEGFTATRDRFMRAGLERYRFIHIATHAVADAEIPQASALILSRFDSHSQRIESHVLAADFMSLQLNAQTVVLSACDTALGRNVAGEGLIGLRYVVLARGAESVVSSLWPIADQVTAQLMSQFYPLLLNGTRSEAALAAAMRKMIKGRFGDPAWWSAFVLTTQSP